MDRSREQSRREKAEKDMTGGQRVIENRQTDRGLDLQKGNKIRVNTDPRT